MARTATSSRPREAIDHTEDDGDIDALELEQLSEELAAAPAADTAEDGRDDTGLPPLRTVSKSRRGSGVLTLIMIALLGMALGFAAVMLA